jgi:alcohol dehydrogenase (cytochrome c)
MRMRHGKLAAALAVLLGTTFLAAASFAQEVDSKRIEANNPNDWLTYHGSYNSYHFSGLTQINTNNVKNLSVAWIHIPGHSTRGLQSMPLAADGVL